VKRSNRDLALAALLAVCVHGGLFGFPGDWLGEGAQLMVAQGPSAIEVEFRSPEERVEIPEIQRPVHEDPPRPKQPEPEPPEITPEDILIPRTDEEDIPPLEAPRRERPLARERSPLPAGAVVERGVKRARLLGFSKPTYPEYCRAHAIEGRVVVVVEVLPNGRAGSVVVKESSGSWRLDRAAVKFYRDEARYRPATRLGRAQKSATTLIVRFELTDEERSGPGPEPEPEL